MFVTMPRDDEVKEKKNHPAVLCVIYAFSADTLTV
jgi:hypothetical protein